MKTTFFIYNYSIGNGWSINSITDFINVFSWILIYDLLSISIINLPFFLFIIMLPAHWQQKALTKAGVMFFAISNAFMILLNTVDIFYFSFHQQRADADLLYVLRNPFANGNVAGAFLWSTLIIYFVLVSILVYWQAKKIILNGIRRRKPLVAAGIMAVVILFFATAGRKMLLPTYPLTKLETIQLPLVQNSLHTFLYSAYRRDEVVLPGDFGMTLSMQQQLFNIHKKNTSASATPRNVILFIMESVPVDFFEIAGKHKVAMPFLDSLVNKSTYYTNAFSYAYSSNKGITSILAAIPTLIDIPLYHSGFAGLKKTAIGKVLEQKGYESAFFIGDNYDDFGFAKVCNWLGIRQYYSMEDIPGYGNMEHHSMGLHDEYVLDFMQQKISAMKQPFVAINYNISTHYPNDLPSSFKDENPLVNVTPAMKTMAYYSSSLQQFFAEARLQPWYENSVIIFCSDHWVQPNATPLPLDDVGSFHIPLFIFDPGNPVKNGVHSPVSQFDILNTLMYYSGSKDSVISYGYNLVDAGDRAGRTIFTKTNTAIYEGINDQYVLGFNASEGKAVYCYNYKTDPQKKQDLLQQEKNVAISQLILEMKAFLQTAVKHYRNQLP